LFILLSFEGLLSFEVMSMEISWFSWELFLRIFIHICS
jgi:hypothetical protein